MKIEIVSRLFKDRIGLNRCSWPRFLVLVLPPLLLASIITTLVLDRRSALSTSDAHFPTLAPQTKDKISNTTEILNQNTSYNEGGLVKDSRDKENIIEHDFQTMCPSSQVSTDSCIDLNEKGWDALKSILNNSSGTLLFCAFHVIKQTASSSIYLRNSIHLQCINIGSCILEGPGALVYIAGDDANVTIQGFSFKGSTNTALTAQNSNLNRHRICNCTFSDNRRIHRGGAIKVSSNTRMVVESSSFYDNHGHWGGAVYNAGSEMIVIYSHFEANGAERGGAIMSEGESNLTLIGNTFIDNVIGRSVVIHEGSGTWKDGGLNLGKRNGEVCSNGFWVVDPDLSSLKCHFFSTALVRFSIPMTSSIHSNYPVFTPSTLSPSYISHTGNATTTPTPSISSIFNRSSYSSVPSFLSFPLRGAFYYTWYPQTWTVMGHHVFYKPDLGYYRSNSQQVVDRHIKSMDYAKIDIGIISWWGPVHMYGLERISLLLERTTALNSRLKWGFYYETEMWRDPTISKIKDDLKYLNETFVNHPAIAKIDGKPIVFVYNNGSPNINGLCDIADRWVEANDGRDWYVVLKVFKDYHACINQPDSWHQYSPGVPVSVHPTSFVISPGFWRANSQIAALERDIHRWNANIRDMVSSQKPWQLITTFNEWGEGTAVESAKDWNSTSGFGIYLDGLHFDGKASY